MVGFVWRLAITRGLFGGNRRWMTVFAAIGAAKLMRRIASREAETVYSEELKPGETLVIRHLTVTHADKLPA